MHRRRVEGVMGGTRAVVKSERDLGAGGERRGANEELEGTALKNPLKEKGAVLKYHEPQLGRRMLKEKEGPAHKKKNRAQT